MRIPSLFLFFNLTCFGPVILDPEPDMNSGDFSLDKIPALKGPNVRIRDRKVVEEKIQRIICDGKEKLQIITDFDRTLSKQHHNGELTKTSFGVFETIPTLPKSFIEANHALFRRFKGIEDDPNLSVDEKRPHMEMWWVLHVEQFLGLKFDPKELDDAVATSGVHLRVGTQGAFQRLHESNVPVLVFSAGLGDVVRSIMKFYEIDLPNVYVISNFFKYGDDFIINGFHGAQINAFNKNQHALEHSGYFEELSHRENVILIGDSLGDSNMDEGVSGNGAVLKIGFLSVNIDDYLPQYMEKFDIVLIDDQTMDAFNGILGCVL